MFSKKLVGQNIMDVLNRTNLVTDITVMSEDPQLITVKPSNSILYTFLNTHHYPDSLSSTYFLTSFTTNKDNKEWQTAQVQDMFFLERQQKVDTILDGINLYKKHIHTLLKIPEYLITNQMVAKLAEALSHTYFGGSSNTSCWREKFCLFLDPINGDSKERRKLFTELLTSKTENVTKTLTLLLEGISLDLIEELENLPEEWIKKAAGKTSKPILDDEDQQIFLELFKKVHPKTFLME